MRGKRGRSTDAVRCAGGGTGGGAAAAAHPLPTQSRQSIATWNAAGHVQRSGGRRQRGEAARRESTGVERLLQGAARTLPWLPLYNCLPMF